MAQLKTQATKAFLQHRAPREFIGEWVGLQHTMRAGSQISSTFLTGLLASFDITALVVGIAVAQLVYAAVLYNLQSASTKLKAE